MNRGHSIRNLQGILYYLIRLQEFAAFSLIIAEPTRRKIILGELVGRVGEYMAKPLMDRLLQLQNFDGLISAVPLNSSFFRAFHPIQPGKDATYDFSLSAVLELVNFLGRLIPRFAIGDNPSQNVCKRIVFELQEFIRYCGIEDEMAALAPGFELTGDIESMATYSHEEWLPDLLATLRRDQSLTYSPSPCFPTKKTRVELVTEKETLASFIHFVITDIEISASEVCCRSLIAKRDIPLDYKIEMGIQVRDEVRHAVILEKRLNAMGAEVGDYTYSSGVFDRYMQFESLAERIASQHIIQEGRGLIDGYGFCQALHEHGETDSGETWEFLNTDESNHVATGNKWVMHLVGHDMAAYVKIIESVMKRSNLENLETVMFPKEILQYLSFPAPKMIFSGKADG